MRVGPATGGQLQWPRGKSRPDFASVASVPFGINRLQLTQASRSMETLRQLASAGGVGWQFASAGRAPAGIQPRPGSIRIPRRRCPHVPRPQPRACSILLDVAQSPAMTNRRCLTHTRWVSRAVKRAIAGTALIGSGSHHGQSRAVMPTGAGRAAGTPPNAPMPIDGQMAAPADRATGRSVGYSGGCLT